MSPLPRCANTPLPARAPRLLRERHLALLLRRRHRRLPRPGAPVRAAEKAVRVEAHVAQQRRAGGQVGGPHAEPQLRQRPERRVEHLEDERRLVVRRRRVGEVEAADGIGDDEEDEAEDARARGPRHNTTNVSLVTHCEGEIQGGRE